MLNGVFRISFAGRQNKSASTRSAAGRRANRSRDYVGDQQNQLVAVGLCALLDGGPGPYNPLVLYGPSGTGKSLLASGVFDDWQPGRSGGPAVYFTATDFGRRYREAEVTQDLPAFRARVREAGLLVIEDLDQLIEKESSQEELICTIDALLQNDGQLIVTMREAPSAAEHLLPALRSRLEAGLSIPLQAPGAPAREVLLRELAAAQDLALAPETIELLVAKTSGTYWELQGLVQQLALESRAASDLDTEQQAARVLAARAPKAVELRTIAQATARHFGVRMSELRSPFRQRRVVLARGVAMYLARELGDLSYEQIGRFFGGRDHSTVLHACRRIEELLRDDVEVQDAVGRIRHRVARGRKREAAVENVSNGCV